MSDKRVLILGAAGMLGHKLAQVLPEYGFDVWAAVKGDPAELMRFGVAPDDRCIGGVDASKFETVVDAVSRVSPGFLVNAIGVIKQKTSSTDTASMIEVNSVFPHRLAGLAADISARLLTFSTDCVFSGSRGGYTENDLPDASDLYGRSKALGEITDGNALTVRTSIIGRELTSSHGLLEWFLSNRGGRVKGFTRAFFSGFPTVSLSHIAAKYILNNSALRGTYHVSSARISKHDLLVRIRDLLDLDIEIEADDELSIDRSLDSSRFQAATGFVPEPWDSLLVDLAKDAGTYTEIRR